MAQHLKQGGREEESGEKGAGTREAGREAGREGGKATYVLLALVFDNEEDEELLDVPVEGRGQICVGKEVEGGREGLREDVG